MKTKQRINSDLKEALKAKRTEKISILRLLRNSINQAQIKKGKDKELTEEEVIEVLQKEAKQRKEAFEQFRKADRLELAKKEKKELGVVEKYLPEKASEEEIEELVEEAIEKTNAQSKNEIGKVMGTVMPKLKGKAEGDRVKKIVIQKLS